MIFQVPASQIGNDIRSGKIKIAVIGLGQVGLPLVLHFAKEGASVIGADIDEEKVNLIKHGICPTNINPLAEIFNQVHRNNNLQATSEVTQAVKNFTQSLNILLSDLCTVPIRGICP